MRSSAAIAAELSDLLGALGVAGPVVVVGSGVGCLHARALAAAGHGHAAKNAAAENTASGRQLPGGAAVAGLVLVEPMVEGVAAAHAALSPVVANVLGEDLRRQVCVCG